MKTKSLIVALTLAMLPAAALAADVSGVWVRDAKSDPRPDAMYWLTRGGESAGGFSLQDFTLTVTQEGGKLVVSNPNLITRAVPLDGQPHVVPTGTLIQKATVTGANQADGVVVTTVQPYGGMPGNATLTIKENWSVSPDGKTLTVTTVRQSPARTTTDKQIYNRRS